MLLTPGKPEISFSIYLLLLFLWVGCHPVKNENWSDQDSPNINHQNLEMDNWPIITDEDFTNLSTPIAENILNDAHPFFPIHSEQTKATITDLRKGICIINKDKRIVECFDGIRWKELGDVFDISPIDTSDYDQERYELSYAIMKAYGKLIGSPKDMAFFKTNEEVTFDEFFKYQRPEGEATESIVSLYKSIWDQYLYYGIISKTATEKYTLNIEGIDILNQAIENSFESSTLSKDQLEKIEFLRVEGELVGDKISKKRIIEDKPVKGLTILFIDEIIFGSGKLFVKSDINPEKILVYKSEIYNDVIEYTVEMNGMRSVVDAESTKFYRFNPTNSTHLFFNFTSVLDFMRRSSWTKSMNQLNSKFWIKGNRDFIYSTSNFNRKKIRMNLALAKELETHYFKYLDFSPEVKNNVNEYVKDKTSYYYLPLHVEEASKHDSKTKYGGLPYLRHKDDWPICRYCSKNMNLVLQFKKDEADLFQHFLCENENCEHFFEKLVDDINHYRWIKIKGTSYDSEEIDDPKYQYEVDGWIKTIQVPSFDVPHKQHLTVAEKNLLHSKEFFDNSHDMSFLGVPIFESFPGYIYKKSDGYEYYYTFITKDYASRGQVFRHTTDKTFKVFWESMM